MNESTARRRRTDDEDAGPVGSTDGQDHDQMQGSKAAGSLLLNFDDKESPQVVPELSVVTARPIPRVATAPRLVPAEILSDTNQPNDSPRG